MERFSPLDDLGINIITNMINEIYGRSEILVDFIDNTKKKKQMQRNVNFINQLGEVHN